MIVDLFFLVNFPLSRCVFIPFGALHPFVTRVSDALFTCSTLLGVIVTGCQRLRAFYAVDNQVPNVRWPSKAFSRRSEPCDEAQYRHQSDRSTGIIHRI